MTSSMLFQRSQLLAKLIPTTATVIHASKLYLHFDVYPSNFRAYSSRKKKVASDKSFTISYLVNSCGLSQEDAEKASLLANFSNNPENPNLVLALFKQYGFSQKQIAYLAKKSPALFLSNVEKTLLPKFDFFTSIGIPAVDIARKVCFDPVILRRSLERCLIPSYKFFRDILGSDEKVVAMFRKRSRLFSYSRGGVDCNVETLQKFGVPKRFISSLISTYPETLAVSNAEFCSVADEVRKMGFDVSKSTYVIAIHARMGKSNRKTWDRCCSLYKKWGWSEDEVQLAFKKCPSCMILSEKNLMETMDYFVNEMGLPPSIVAHFPRAVCCSLEKRIKPRCSVIRILRSKGIHKKDVNLGFLIASEKVFLERYVKRYEEQLPNLLAFYEGKIGVSGL